MKIQSNLRGLLHPFPSKKEIHVLPPPEIHYTEEGENRKTWISSFYPIYIHHLNQTLRSQFHTSVKLPQVSLLNYKLKDLTIQHELSESQNAPAHYHRQNSNNSGFSIIFNLVPKFKPTSTSDPPKIFLHKFRR